MHDLTKPFGIEILAKGSFKDEETSIIVSIIVIRANARAMNDFIDTTIWNDRMCYNTDEEYEEYLSMKEESLLTWKKKIAELLNIPWNNHEGFCITQNVSEIFTVVSMSKIKEE